MQPSFDKNRRRPPGKFMFFPLIAVALAMLLGLVVKLLWNALLPDILHTPKINYWQAVGLLILSRILFGNFGGKGRGRGGMGNGEHFQGRGGMMREKWMQMSEEERMKFKDEWRDRCRNRGGWFGRQPGRGDGE